jgi:hypothetical protein
MRWSSAIDLGLPAAAPGPDPDTLLTLADPASVAPGPPPGDLLADLPGRFAFARDAEGVVRLRFHGLGEFVIAPGEPQQVTATLVPGTDEGFAAVLATGMLATVLLVLRGHPVLHGSAVAHDGSAIAFVGASGMGKSTLSSLLCADGAALVTDDVLRLDGLLCRNGPVESRLRVDPEGSPSAVRRTADGRAAVTASALAPDRVPLAVLAVPYPSREVSEVRADWLGPKDALLELLRFPRIVGWCDPPTTAAHFAFVADLARRVPVARLTVPWQSRPSVELAAPIRVALLDLPPG